MLFQQQLIASLTTHRNRIAIVDGHRELSYRELQVEADRIMFALLRRGIGRQTILGVCADDRIDLITTMIGVIQAGCVFVPIDPMQPLPRLTAVLENLDAEHLLCTERTATLLPDLHGRPSQRLYLEDLRKEPVQDGLTMPTCDPEDSLYIYFTSGTTGRPKGIVGRNDSLLQFLQWEINYFGFGAGSRFSQFVSPYFDAFLRDVFVPLMVGGTICIPPREEDFFAPDKLISWVESSGIQVIHCVPSLFRILNDPSLSAGRFPSLQYILMSGEKVSPAELTRWFGVFGPRIQLVNLYGPTETTMIRSYYLINPEDAQLERIPVGYPIAGTEFRILRKDGRLCETLVPGELFILSDHMTKGYLNAPGLTAEKFVWLNPGTPEERRAFRTGDTARLLSNGKIDLIGREDRQIKWQGVRIEPDEIENILMRSGLVRQAVVINREEQGTSSLLCFVVPSEGPAITALADSALSYLRQHLPAYMIPSAVVEVSTLPLLSNGKINYRELIHLPAGRTLVAPAGEIERRLLSVWKEILGDKSISTEDNFHRMGGNSLAIMRLISCIYKEFGVRLPLQELFKNLTIKGQSALIAKTPGSRLWTIPRAPERPSYPLSAAQQRMYVQYELDRNSTAYNLPMIWEINHAFQKRKLIDRIGMLIERHESLRTSFLFEDGALLQVVHDRAHPEIEEIDDPDVSLEEIVRSFVRPFDLSKAPLLRVGIVFAGDGRKFLLTDLHHIICDGISQMILYNDFTKLYRGEALSPLNIQYKDYAQWEASLRRSTDYLLHREFWLKQFEGDVPRLNLPGTEANGGSAASTTFSIDKQMIQPYLDLLAAEDITTFSGLFSLFFVFLAQVTGQNDMVTGIAASGRTQEELEGVVGTFAKVLPIRYRIVPGGSWRDLAKSLHGHLIQAIGNQIYDLADILQELNSRRAAPLNDLIHAVFSFQNYLSSNASSDLFLPFAVGENDFKYPLTLAATEAPDRFIFRLEYPAGAFTESDVSSLVVLFQTVARSAGDRPREGRVDDSYRKTDRVFVLEESITFNL